MTRLLSLLLLSGCAPAEAQPREPALPEVVRAAAPVPDGEAVALEARMRRWQPLSRERSPGELAVVASAIVTACRANPWPTPERCPDMLGALTFRESSWDPEALGARREIGLAQLHGAALAGETREAAFEPGTNLRLALAWLKRCALMCRLAGRDSVDVALGMYATGKCRVYRGVGLLLRWEGELRAAGTGGGA